MSTTTGTPSTVNPKPQAKASIDGRNIHMPPGAHRRTPYPPQRGQFGEARCGTDRSAFGASH
ncbi:hypothetical protein AB0K35_13180 [Micromonospora sp. NPDC053740]|uniref:hypothetical protein n=1 Tax=Micromonospora sp. NPDC053740 TaxID=3155173 RepID=UPI003436DA7F